MTDLIQDIETQLSALNVRLHDADGDQRDALLDKEEERSHVWNVGRLVPASSSRYSRALTPRCHAT